MPWTLITNPEEFVVAILWALGDGIGINDSDNYKDENEGGSGGILAAARCWWQWEHGIGRSGNVVVAAAAQRQPVGAAVARQRRSGSATVAAWQQQHGSNLAAAGSMVAAAVAATASLTLVAAQRQLRHQHG